MGERRTPDAPHPGKRRPLRVLSCRPHSAQSQLARAHAVGLVTGPHARIPPHPQPVGSAPRQPAQRAGSRGRGSARPRTPHTQARGALVGHPHAAPTAHKASSQERALWGWWWVPTPASPRAHSQWVVGPGSPPRGRAVGGGRAPDPGPPTPRHEAPPPGTLMPPPQHATERAVGLVTGPHAHTPPHQQPVGSGPQQPAQRAGSRGWESARPWTPHTQARAAPPPGRPRAAPTARKASSQDGSPCRQPPAPTASG